MPPAPFPEFRWLFRTIRVLPVVAGAALAGGIIGGFSVLAIDLALTAPPNHNIAAEPGSKIAKEAGSTTWAAHPAAPAPTFSAAGTSAPATPAQSLAASTGLPASGPPVSAAATIPPVMAPARPGSEPETIAVVRPQANASGRQATLPVTQQTSWPDALSHKHKSASSETEVANHDRAALQPLATAEVLQKTEQTPSAVKRRVAVRRYPSSERVRQTSSANSRPLYDYDGRDERSAADDDARGGYEVVKPHYVRPRQAVDLDRSDDRGGDRSYRRSEGRSAARYEDDSDDDALPPQPAPPRFPFLGLFGGDRYDDR